MEKLRRTRPNKMGSTQVLAKLSKLIQMTTSSAENVCINVKNCQALAATIQNLACMINEIQEDELPIVGGAITVLEGLEAALSRARGLIVRYGSETSRLYAVLRRQRLSQKFKLLALEIATHLASLPMGALHLTTETQKQVEDCILDLREADFDTDGEEDLILGTNLILKEVKDGVKVNHEKLTDLTSRFNLSCNQDILREVALLQKERDIVRMERDKHEEELINQLLILATRMEEDLAQHTQAQVEFGGIPVPSDFRCPLSLQLMSDPVIVASGQTYERVYIQQWLDQGNTTCPKTRQTLSHTNLIPNYTVKALIAGWYEANKVPFPQPSKLSCATNPKLGCGTSSSTGVSGVLSERESKPRIPNSLHNQVERHLPKDVNGGNAYTMAGCSGTFDHFTHTNSRQSTYRGLDRYDHSTHSHSRNTSSCSIGSSTDDALFSSMFNDNSTEVLRQPSEGPSCDDTKGDVQRFSIFSGSNRLTFSGSVRERSHGPTKVASSSATTDNSEADARANISKLVADLESDSIDVRRNAASSLRLLAKHSVENRILIANCGAIKPLVSLLDSTDPDTRENAVTALLNLSIDNQNKNEIAAAGAIDALVRVLSVGTAAAKENSAATLFSLSVMDENKVAVGESGAIPRLVDLLIHGSPRGKKDAATALFNLSILHENKARIVSGGAIRPLVELMLDPAAGMVDKAVTVLANLATITEGRKAIGEEGGIPALVEVVEMGSQRGKENAAAALLHLCTKNHKFRAMVLQEGAIPPLVSLSQSGTPRAKEKASSLLRHFREQRQAVLGRGARERHVDQPLPSHPYV